MRKATNADWPDMPLDYTCGCGLYVHPDNPDSKAPAYHIPDCKYFPPGRMPQKFLIKFLGREIGAIGITDLVQIEVEADTPLQARWRAYTTHEHIVGGIDGVIAQEVE